MITRSAAAAAASRHLAKWNSRRMRVVGRSPQRRVIVRVGLARKAMTQRDSERSRRSSAWKHIAIPVFDLGEGQSAATRELP